MHKHTNNQNEKFSLYERNVKIHKNLWKIYSLSLLVGVVFIFFKDLFNIS